MVAEEKGKLIAAFCSAINDDERPRGRETFRWLRKCRILLFPLVAPGHRRAFPSSLPIFPFPRVRLSTFVLSSLSPRPPLDVLVGDVDDNDDVDDGSNDGPTSVASDDCVD